MTRLRIRGALAGAALLVLAACGGSAPEADTASTAGKAPATQTAMASDGATMTVYKTPTCGCCKAWVDHVKAAGFRVDVRDMENPQVAAVKAEHGVPGDLHSCHTALVGGYVVEGHVPAPVIRKLLAERPKVQGIAVPGMPMGSPGMEGPYSENYDVLAFTRDGQTRVYSKH